MISAANRRRVEELALDGVPPKDICSRLNLIPDEVYLVIKKARARGVAIPSFAGTKKAEARAKLEAAEDAIRYLLDRSKVDDALYYRMGRGTEAFRRLTIALALLRGEAVEDVVARYG